MNKISPKKLLNSKWTAIQPLHKAKHFMVVEVDYDEDGNVLFCLLEALMSKKVEAIEWKSLKDSDIWLQGWK